jgi:DHA2 family multidrug resistance protein
VTAKTALATERPIGQAIVMTPLSAIAMVGIASAEAGAASGLFNMMRNLGGADRHRRSRDIFSKREPFHSFIINAHVL